MKKAIVMVYRDKVEIKSEETGYVFTTYYFIPTTHGGETLMTVSTDIFDELEHMTDTGWKYKVLYA